MKEEEELLQTVAIDVDPYEMQPGEIVAIKRFHAYANVCTVIATQTFALILIIYLLSILPTLVETIIFLLSEGARRNV